MASKLGMAYRNEAAQGRIDASLPTIATRLGVEVAPMPSNRRDPILQEALRLEWMADVLESIHDAIPDDYEAASAGGDEPDGDITFDRDELKEMKLDDLKVLAIESGADEESVSKMRAKDDVIDVLDALLASGDIEPGSGDEGDDTGDAA